MKKICDNITLRERIFGSTASTPEPVVFGVAHNTDTPDNGTGELNRVLRGLIHHRPKSVGIELETTYLRDEALGIFDPFFGVLARELTSRGIQVVPLDDPSINMTYDTLQMACLLVDGHVSIENLAKSIANAESAIKDPNTPEARRVYLKSHCKPHLAALSIVKKRSPEQIRKMMSEISEKRERNMLRGIKDSKVDAAVIGAAHAVHLRTMLPEYKFVIDKCGTKGALVITKPSSSS